MRQSRDSGGRREKLKKGEGEETTEEAERAEGETTKC